MSEERKQISAEKWKKSSRRTWGIRPTTQITPSEREYNRAREKQEVEELLTEMEEDQGQEHDYGHDDDMEDWYDDDPMPDELDDYYPSDSEEFDSYDDY